VGIAKSKQQVKIDTLDLTKHQTEGLDAGPEEVCIFLNEPPFEIGNGVVVVVANLKGATMDPTNTRDLVSCTHATTNKRHACFPVSRSN
jgi:hypothetical protein